jgi:phosphotriesterase-related protein
MPGIQSVTGPVDAADLGSVLCHEHVAASSPGIIRSWPALHGGREALLDRGVRAVAAAKKAGIDTLVDCTTFDLGRDPELLVDVSEATGVTIIASTGCWVDPSATMRARTVDQLAEWFLADLTEGVDGTSVRAGLIKLASDQEVLPFAALVLEAAARASNATGAPIITHTAAAYRTGEAQADLLESFGVPPSRVAIGHSDDSDDIGYLAGLAARGYRIAMDRIPNGALPNYGGQDVADRMDMVVRLVDLGFGDRVLLGHDDPIWAALLDDDDAARHIASNPRQITFISEVVLPGLAERGLDGSAVRALMVDNPRAWLTGVPVA